MRMKERKQNKKIFIIFELVFWAAALSFLGINISKMLTEEWNNITALYILGVILIVIFVHTIKALRLYIILFGNNFNLEEYLEVYVKTAAVNLLLPFKCGEIYRGLCIGGLIGGYAEGYIVVIFDRFVDTLALITIVAGAGVLSGFEITFTYLLLACFLLLVIAIYCLFMPLYEYWNHFLIFKKKSEHTLRGLQFLSICKSTFIHINEMVKGRFIILYLLSLAAWGVEVGYFLLLTNVANEMAISTYLSDVLAGTLNANNAIYMIVCLVVFLICGGVLASVKIFEKVRK